MVDLNLIDCSNRPDRDVPGRRASFYDRRKAVHKYLNGGKGAACDGKQLFFVFETHSLRNVVLDAILCVLDFGARTF